MTSTQSYSEHGQLPLQEPPGTPPYITELFREMSSEGHPTVTDISSQYTADLADGVWECGNVPASSHCPMQEVFDTTYDFAHDQSRLYGNSGFRANGFTVFDTTQPSITHHLSPSASGYLNDEFLLPHGTIETPVDHRSGRFNQYHMGRVDSIYTAVPESGWDTISYLYNSGHLHVDTTYSLDWPIMTNDSSVQADDSILLSTQFCNPGLGISGNASRQSQPQEISWCPPFPRPVVEPNVAISQADRRVSTKRKRATCQGIFGECPHRAEDTRCFTQVEIDTCNRLCNLLTGRPLGWSIYGLGSGDVKLFRSNWPNAREDQIDACWRYINCFRSYNMLIHRQGLCEVANEKKTSNTIFRQQTHYPTQSWDKDLSDLLIKVLDTLAEWDIGQLEVLPIGAQPSMHNGNAFFSAAEPPTSNIASSVPYTIFPFDSSIDLSCCEETGNSACHSSEKQDSSQEDKAGMETPHPDLAPPLTYIQANVANNNQRSAGKLCQGKLLSCTCGRQYPVQLLTGIYLELFQYIYAAQSDKREADWDVFAPVYRNMPGGGSANFGKVVIGGNKRKQILRKYMTQCRRVICQTHNQGFCGHLMEQLSQQGINGNFTQKPVDFVDSFKAVEALPESAWAKGRPLLFQAIEDDHL
jgi:hypothetical protein